LLSNVPVRTFAPYRNPAVTFAPEPAMSSITAIDPARAEGKARETLAAVQKMLGATPNLFRVTAHAPAALESMAAQFGALAGGVLGARGRESIALTVAEVNGCDYCLSAHTLLGKGAGLSEADILAARGGESSDPKLGAILGFSRELVQRRGAVGGGAVDRLRSAGVSDAEILETIAAVTLNIFTNYVNLVAGTEIDFPVVRAGVR
jgi:uncharacterized peroxidase-related enzyme